MKKLICLFVILAMLLPMAVISVSAAEELVFPVSETTGKWGTLKAAPGYDGGAHKWSSEKGATFKFALDIPKDGNYELYFWKSVHENTTNNMPINLTRGDKTETISIINQKTGESGWELIGVFDFKKGNGSFVSGEVIKPTARISGVKLVETNKAVTEIVLVNPYEATEEKPAEEKPEITDDTVYFSQEVKGITDGEGIIFPLSEAKGTWAKSATIPGYDGKAHFYSYNKGSSFKIGIDVPEAGNYELYYWKSVHTNSNSSMQLELTHNGKTELVKAIDLTTGETGWESVGVFNFDDVNEAYLGKVIDKSNYRVSAVKIVKTDKEATTFEAVAAEEPKKETEKVEEVEEDITKKVVIQRETVGEPSEDGGLIFPISEAIGDWKTSKAALGYDGNPHY